MFIIFLAFFAFFTEGVPILGGKDVRSIAKYRFLAHIEIEEVIFKNNTYIEKVYNLCAGAIIAPDVVLTAGHCLMDSLNEPQITIRAGLLRRSEDQNVPTSTAKEYIIYNDSVEFNPHGSSDGIGIYYDDIALVWLAVPFGLNQIQLATLADSAFKVDNKVGLIAGWGKTDSGYYADQLQEGEVRVVSNKYCKNAYKSITVSKSMLCVLSDTNKTIECFGDSGGPLVINGVVVGIASAAESDILVRDDGKVVQICNPSVPGIYTKVSKYRKWIEEHLGKAPSKKRGNNENPVDENSTLDKSDYEEHKTFYDKESKKKTCTIL